ncbi:hypothetical protein C1645_765314 [Glomus cerebriforme]|uniref:B30.2/SPRY domain-containing protein n=1 Tax=Glomus cerebriforme TaxID=658196 RepID=A0A397T7Z6_9GLOM|nr:hypothetical protein C1645_765314 [Glomus cerebriforme]
MNTVKVKNGGRIIEINPKTWSSVVKDACVQSNYPFYVPLPPNLKKDNNNEGETLNEKEEIIIDKISKDDEKEKELFDEKVEDDKQESISDKIRKKLQQKKKYLQQQIIHKSPKIEEIMEEYYKDCEGFNYFEITILEKEDSHTNIAIGVATKPFPCYRLPGHMEYSIGYHSNTGQVYQNSMYNGWEYGPSWNNIHTTIGCGYKPLSGEIYFTFNGFILGTLYTADVEYDALNEKRYYLFPSIGANGKCKIRVNFGEEEFIYRDSYEKITESESDYISEDDDIINSYHKNSVDDNNHPLGKWKDVRLETDEKVWWNTINTINTIA